MVIVLPAESRVSVSSAGFRKFVVSDAMMSSLWMSAFHFFSAVAVIETVRGR